MALENLDTQGDIIDKGEVQKDEILNEDVVYGEPISLTPQIDNRAGLSTKEIASRQKALDIFNQAGPQVKDEFLDFDPELDRGAMPGMDQNELRAHNQTAGDLWKAGAFRFINELALGTVESTALMADFGMHVDAFKGIEQDFSNDISRKIKEYKEQLNEQYGKVYTSKEDEGFSPLSGSFWANNAGNIATSLTLMLPSMAAGKLLRGMVKGSKLLRAARIGKSGEAAIAGLTSAAMSRLTENAMEASEAVQATRQSLIDPTTGQYIVNPKTGVQFTEEEVNKIAGDAGRSTWGANWPMILTDIFQYGKMFKGMDFARKTAQNVGAKSLLKSIGGFVTKDMGSEALEEGYQYIASQESQYRAKSKSGLDDGSTFYERIGKYIEDDEFKTSAFMGAIGGGLFSGVGAINQYKEGKSLEAQRAALEELHKKNNAILTGNSEAFNQAEDSAIVGKAVEYAAQGTLDLIEADLSDLYNTNSKELEEQGLDPEDYRKKVSRAQRLVKDTATEFNKVKNSNIPIELQTTVLASRMERKVSEQRIKELSSEYDSLYEADEEIFKGKEKKTASQLVQLKKLKRAENTKKAEEVEKQILEQSDVYKSKEDIRKTLETSNDDAYKLLDVFTEAYNSNIEKAKEVETLLKSDKGREELTNRVKEEQKKVRKRRAAEAKKKEQEKKEEVEEMTPEEAAYAKTVKEAVEEYGEFETTEPDSKKVFTTSLKGHGGRTWVSGEIVRDKKGNEYRVGKPKRKGNFTFGITAYKLKNGKQVGTKPVHFDGVKMLDLLPESKKPGHTEWTVNKFQFDKTKKNLKSQEVEKASEEKRETETASGIVKGVNTEFTNFGKPGQKYNDPRFFPEGEVPEKRKQGEGEYEERYSIDYELASDIMDPDNPTTVSLEVDDTYGFTAILVKQGDKIITKLQRQGKEEQFDALSKYIGSKGGSISAAIKDKTVSYTGNLANMRGAEQSLNILKDSKYLPDGKIFIGSYKQGEGMMKFVASDGSVKEIPWKSVKAARENTMGKKPGTGNTYMLLLTPNGTEVAVMLKESKLKDIQENGIPMSDSIFNDMTSKADELTKTLNDAIDKYIKKGYTQSDAIEKVYKSEEFTSILHEEANKIKAGKVRDDYSKDEVKLDSGKTVKVRKKDNFTVSLMYQPVVETIEGQKVYKPGKVVMYTKTSQEAKYPSVSKPYTEKIDTDPEVVKEILSERFVETSIDSMLAEGGGDYVKKAIEDKWVTTDIYHKRPWVNTQISVQLDAEATAATKGTAKKRAPKTASRTKTSKSKQTKATTNTVLAKDAITSAVKQIGNIIDIAFNEKKKTELENSNKGITAEEFVNEYLNGLIDPKEFVEDVLANAASDTRETFPRTKIRDAAKKIIEESISEAFESGSWDNTAENSKGEEVGESTKVEDDSNEAVLLRALKREGRKESEAKSLQPNIKRILIKAQRELESNNNKNNKISEKVVKEKVVTDKKVATTRKSKRKRPTFVKPDVKTYAKKEADINLKVSEKGKAPIIDKSKFDNLLNAVNDIPSAGSNLSSSAKKKIQNEAEIKCKK